MKLLIVNNTRRIKIQKNKIEKNLGVKISIRGKEVSISGKEINEYDACNALSAIDSGFSPDVALLLKDENYMLETLNIKKHSKKQNLKRIRGLIIGEKGRTRELIQELSNCFIKINSNIVSIVGRIEDIETASQAVISLIKGAKHSSVYSYLEKSRKLKKYDEDLGIVTNCCVV